MPEGESDDAEAILLVFFKENCKVLDLSGKIILVLNQAG